MPSSSTAQHNAMEAAAHGKSTLGIPKKVGKEFVAADAALPIAAGTVFVSPEGKVLMLKRAGVQGVDNYVGHWSLPGGKGEPGETPEQTADRESAEELGNTAPISKKKLLDRVKTPNGMIFHTFAQPVHSEFQPQLNEEHSECGWFSVDDLPKPLHPSVGRVLRENLGVDTAQDMQPEDWEALRANFAKWTREEEAEPEHADDNQPMLATTGNTGIPLVDGMRKKKNLAQDSVCEACAGAGCDKCGVSGVAPLTKAPMKPGLGGGAFDMAGFMRGLGTLASDEGFNEGDHPRAPDGKFGSGSGGASAKSAAKGSAEAKGALKMDALKKTGGKLGSNEGGSYEDDKGAKYYIKKAPTKAHADNERAAARLYQLAGAATLPYRDVEGGQHIATEWRKLEKKNISEFTPTERKEAAKDFAIHAWLSNWDAAGTGGDNQGILEGKTTTLDVGGSLRFRAQGGPKGGAFGDKVTEFDTLRDKGMNPDAAKLFAPMTKEEIAASIERVSKIPNDKIREAVGDDKELADRLIARKKNLASRVGLMAMDGMFAGLERYGDVMAFDRSMLADMNRYGMAFDRQPSLRRVDKDGHMLVESSVISAAAVNDYMGREIPGFKSLGLDPDKIYALYRTEEDMEKGAQSLHGKPLLLIHKGVSADNHDRKITVGTVINPIWEKPNLRAELSIWDGEAIKLIESGDRKSLSAGYRYVPVMEPGEYNDKKFDGKMTEILFNHLALVDEPRVEGAVVGDEATDPWVLIESAILRL